MECCKLTPETQKRTAGTAQLQAWPSSSRDEGTKKSFPSCTLRYWVDIPKTGFVDLRGFYVSVLLNLTQATIMTAKDTKPCRVFSKTFTRSWIDQIQDRFKRNKQPVFLNVMVYFTVLFRPVIGSQIKTEQNTWTHLEIRSVYCFVISSAYILMFGD